MCMWMVNSIAYQDIFVRLFSNQIQTEVAQGNTSYHLNIILNNAYTSIKSITLENINTLSNYNIKSMKF